VTPREHYHEAERLLAEYELEAAKPGIGRSLSARPAQLLMAAHVHAVLASVGHGLTYSRAEGYTEHVTREPVLPPAEGGWPGEAPE
jgi:hypothetical protein